MTKQRNNMTGKSRGTRRLHRDVLKLKSELGQKKRNEATVQKMYDCNVDKLKKKLQVAEAETNIFRNSVKNFAVACYAQKNELRRLHKYIRHKKRERGTRASRKATKTLAVVA